ncbi:MAG: glycosyltransferase involved in cell wall biosynthesis [Parvicella sp.]
MENLAVSVIIPTYNRANQLPFLFDSLSNQTFGNFELVLINDGSRDDTITAVNLLHKKYSLDLIFHSIENSGRSKSRNYGVSKSSGELLIFFDDDVRPNKDSIANHLDYHCQNDNVILGGPYRYDENLFSRDFHHFRKKMEDAWYPNNRYSDVQSLRINGGNFSVTKNLFQSVGGFEERLNDKEDFFFAHTANRLFESNVVLDLETWVYHDDYKTFSEYLERVKETTAREQNLLKIDPLLIEKDPLRFSANKVGFFRRVLDDLLRTALVQEMIEHRFFANLPPKLRYWIYDLSISAVRTRELENSNNSRI